MMASKVDDQPMVQLTDDGELVTASDDHQTAPEEPTKPKNVEFNTPPTILWGRPFPDAANYDRAELYIDPDIRGEWGYTVLLKWTTGSGTNIQGWNKRIQAGGFPDEATATKEGIDAYRHRVALVVSRNEGRQKPTLKDYLKNLAVSLLLATFVAAIVVGGVVAVAKLEMGLDGVICIGGAVLFLSAILAWSLTADLTDYR